MSGNPYQSPLAAPGFGEPNNLSTGTPHQHQYQFKPIRVLAICLVVCVAIVSIAAMMVSTMELTFEKMWPGFNDPYQEFATETAEMAAMLMTGIALLSLIPGLAVMVLGPMFSYRSNANLRSLGVHNLEYTPGWCAGYWFIPIANLFRPYQATREVYVASEDRLPKTIAPPMSPFLGWWWFFYLVGSIVSNIEGRMAMRGIYFPETFHLMSFVSSGMMFVAGILFIRIVMKIASNQSEAAGVLVR